MISDLPRDLASEVFSRLPLTSLRSFRSTCKTWNNLAKDESFTKKHISEANAASEFIKVMVIDCRVYLVSLNLANPSINRQAELISLVDSDREDISDVYHCDGLLLCITKDFNGFVVWNPYTGQTQWFRPRLRDTKFYGIGYDKRKSYKVLRFIERDSHDLSSYEIYELNSNSCKVFDVSFDWRIKYFARGVSLKGNTYLFAQDKMGGFLICFDFTTERFGPRLSLPFQSDDGDAVTLSSVREENLAVLYNPQRDLRVEIWVTTTIEPQAVAWSKFLAVDMEPLIGFTQASFFIEEEKKTVMIFAKDRKYYFCPGHNVAYFIGENGYFRKVDIEKTTYYFEGPQLCSYAPSLVHINQRDQRKNRKRKRKNMVVIN